MTISFCTPCHNRTYQLRKTFERNARLVAAKVDTEWVIVNYNSDDDLDAFMAGVLPGLTERIVYVREISGRRWHASVAKNVAHRNATGEVLFNLDCDNFIGEHTPAAVEGHFLVGGQVLHMWSGERGDGTGGRIALSRELFHRLGGYDEAFHPMGYQDFDLLARAEAAGFPVTRCGGSPDLALRNTKEESIRYCDAKGLRWEDFDRQNRARSRANLAAHRLVANVPRGWAPMKIETIRGGRSDGDGKPTATPERPQRVEARSSGGSWAQRAWRLLGVGRQNQPENPPRA